MDLKQFANRWVDDWNSHDLERIIDHYAENAEFRSPKAAERLGDGIVRGHDALRAYWGPALENRPALRFHLNDVFSGHQTVSIHYGYDLGRNVVETLLFDDDGKAVIGCGCYA